MLAFSLQTWHLQPAHLFGSILISISFASSSRNIVRARCKHTPRRWLYKNNLNSCVIFCFFYAFNPVYQTLVIFEFIPHVHKFRQHMHYCCEFGRENRSTSTLDLPNIRRVKPYPTFYESDKFFLHPTNTESLKTEC